MSGGEVPKRQGEATPPKPLRPLLVTHSGTFHLDDAFAYAVLRLALGLECLGHERVVLGAQVGLVRLGAGHERLAVAGLRRGELVLALEAADVADRHVELMGDPGVGAALAHPGADLVQLGLQRSACQTAPETSNG